MASHPETTRILHKLLADGLNERAGRLLSRMRPADRGPVIAGLSPVEIRLVMELLDRGQQAAGTLRELPHELLPLIFEVLPGAQLAQIFARLEIDDLVELFPSLDEAKQEEVRALLPETRQRQLAQAERYPPDSAGRAMVTELFFLREDTTAQQAIDRIREGQGGDDAILYLYVVDAKTRLRGVVPIRRLVAAAPERLCFDLMIPDPVCVRAHADQEEVARLVGRYNLLAVPVVDDEERLVGVITVDDVVEMIQEEATEDMYNLAGLDDEDRVFSTARSAFKKRLPWMALNLCATFLAAWVVGLFEQTIEKIVALAFFMPVVAGMGGGGGIQSLTVITRAIALEEIEFSSGLRAVLKELRVAAMLGVLTGIASGLLAWLWQGNAVLGLVLFLTMMSTMAVAGVLGAAAPLLLKQLNLDPAVGSGVFVTNLADIFGFAAFLGIGTLMMERF